MIKEIDIEAPRSNIECVLEYDDLRDWIASVEAKGDLKIVTGANWHTDIGQVVEVMCHDEGTPSVLFDKVEGCPDGFRILINWFTGTRKNLTLGFPESFDKLELSRGYSTHTKKMEPIAHELIDNGPVFENILEGEDIDITKFPAPLWNPEDGGRYIGTGCFNITRDPDNGWINCGTYRVMIHDSKRVGLYISPGKHGRIHREKYMANGEPMPVCIVVGTDPLSFLTSSTEVPEGTSELDMMGAYRGKPIQCVTGKHTGLPFPANSEVVIEGFIHPGNTEREGPFGEWLGYQGSAMEAEPWVDISAIYHRNDPILLGAAHIRLPYEYARYRAISRSAILKENISKAGIPDVTEVWAHEVGGSRLFLAVAIKQRYPGHAVQAGHIAAMCHAGAYLGRFVIVVDEDVDVTSLEEVIWAACTRCDPATNIGFIKNAWSSALDPIISPEDRKAGKLYNSRAIIDACRPFHWKENFQKVNAPSPEARREAWNRWSYLRD
ncbi:MAG: UbiD-like decarboxylase [Alphaproteobacteria bacterium MarineAlpha11_Bin1]|nr:MAG: UbiD-like decarboxylase [Alphaproteobacteria bacterium MarineAlpha11_Bin1]|tara:strand:- start:2847 stop:4328 length:1482 start_codon:yes stop_codon:yes gene_type:complete